MFYRVIEEPFLCMGLTSYHTFGIIAEDGTEYHDVTTNREWAQELVDELNEFQIEVDQAQYIIEDFLCVKATLCITVRETNTELDFMTA